MGMKDSEDFSRGSGHEMMTFLAANGCLLFTLKVGALCVADMGEDGKV